MARIGFVYFVGAEAVGMVKIGHSDNPSMRFSALQVSCPVPLQPLGLLRGSVQRERNFHLRFGHLRSHGEWFRADPELMRFIAEKTHRWKHWEIKARDYTEEESQLRHRRQVEELVAWARMEARLPEIGLRRRVGAGDPVW